MNKELNDKYEEYKNMERPGDDELLNFTMHVRKDLALRLRKEILDSERSVDFEVGTLLNSTLDSIDKQVFTKQKIKIDEDAAKSDEETKALLASLLNDPSMHLGALNKMAERTSGEEVDFKVPDNLPTPEIVPGHTDVKTQQLSYSSIVDGIPDEEE